MSRLAIIGLLGLVTLPGCLSLGVTGSAKPNDSTEVVIGADVDETGRIRPDGKVIFDLF